MRHLYITMLAWPILFSACASPVFPLKAMEGVDFKFDFSRWRLAPDDAGKRKIQLGGRILSSTTQGEILMIVVAQLPIVDRPVYGPEETEKRNGEFVILYRPHVDAQFLRPGNHIMAVGQTGPSIQVEVERVLLRLPTLVAECLHFWNRSGNGIEISGSPGAGARAVDELTYCATAL